MSMVLADLQGVAQAVLSRARDKGFVVPRQVREELDQAGMDVARWKEVIELARPSLKYRNGRYYYVSSIKARMRREYTHNREVRRAARHLIGKYKAANVSLERRSQRRTHFIQPVTVFTEDGRELHMLSEDLSLTGMRLIGAHDLRGQKVRIVVPSVDHGRGQYTFVVQMLWSTRVGDALVETGGLFLDIHEESET